MSEPPVRTLGRYQLLEEIGRGGMGVVYRALDTTLHREVAIKILPPELVADPERKRRFLVEAQTASQLEHPHIGVIHEVGDADGMSFIAMELIRGEKLSDVLARQDLSAARAIELATEVAEGLALAHDKGVVHRDLKPANVMVTEHGHAKIIDFGLAKLVKALSGDAAETVAATNPGVVMGTAAYMSPEQARAGKVDARSDIFSFGVMLYEMLAHRQPFRRQSDVDTLHALLHDPAPLLPPLGPAVTDDASADLQRILEKCLAKEPDARYQGARDIVVDLRAARRRLESGATMASKAVAPQPTRVAARRPRTLIIGLAAAGVVMIAVLTAWLWVRFRSAGAPAAAGSKPSVAVLYFQNNTGNAQLDWLRTGLTEMIVTDLSQSPDVTILGTDRLFQILRDLHRQNDPVVSFDTVQEIARRAGVRHVLLGSYVKSGDTIRITATLQEASTGEIVRSEHIDATGEANLFPMVDDLTQRIKTQFATAAAVARRGLVTAPGTPADAGGSRRLADVTTSSPEAYRLYAQALEAHQGGRETEAARFYEQAVTIDPEFALAMTRLSIVYGNLGQWDLREQWARRALDHADRLSQREHLYVEGSYYTIHDETLPKAIESYKKLVAIYPDDTSTWNNLGVIYADRLNNIDEATVNIEAAARLGPNNTIAQVNLSTMYARAGHFEKSRAVLEDFLARDSRNASIHRGLAGVLFTFDALDEASAESDRADAIDGDLGESLGLRWVIAAMRDRAADQANVVRALQQSRVAFNGFLGTHFGAWTEAYAGRTTTAIRVFDGWLAKQPPHGSDQTAILRTFEARFLLALGRPALALTEANRATAEAKSTTPGWDSAYYAVLAQSRLGRDADAAKALETLQARVEKVPGTREQRNLHWLRGVIALDHGRVPEAIAELRQADGLLTPRGTIPPPPIHVRVWFDLGRAYLAARDDPGAAATFEKIVTRSERALYPIEYVRSLYFLGQIAERRGDRDQARKYYQRFVDHWASGDIDRERVAEAKQKLASWIH